MTEPATTEASSTAQSGMDAGAFASRRALTTNRFLGNRLAVAALAVLMVMLVGCYALPPFLPWSYTDLDFLAL